MRLFFNVLKVFGLLTIFFLCIFAAYEAYFNARKLFWTNTPDEWEDAAGWLKIVIAGGIMSLGTLLLTWYDGFSLENILEKLTLIPACLFFSFLWYCIDNGASKILNQITQDSLARALISVGAIWVGLVSIYTWDAFRNNILPERYGWTPRPKTFLPPTTVQE